MAIRDHLNFHRRFAGLDGEAHRSEGESPLSKVADRLVAEHDNRETTRLANAEDRAALAGKEVIINAVQRYERRAASTQWNDDSTPACTKLDAYSMIKDASYANPEDRGIKTASYILYSAWTDDVAGSLNLRDLRELKARVQKEHPKTKLASVIDHELLPQVGFNTLRNLPKLSRIASEVTDQASYEQAIYANGLDGDENIRARAFIRALLEMDPEESVKSNANSYYDRVASRLAQLGEAPAIEEGGGMGGSPGGMGGPGDGMGGGSVENDMDAGMPPHEEEGEASVEMTSPITGEPLVLELGAGEPEGAQPMAGMEPDSMGPAMPTSMPAMPGGSMHSPMASRAPRSRFDAFQVIGQLSEMMGPGEADTGKDDMPGDPKPDMDGAEPPEGEGGLIESEESMGMIEDPTAPGQMLEVTLKKIEDEGLEPEEEPMDDMGEMGEGLEMESGMGAYAAMEHCAEHDCSMSPEHKAEFHKVGPSKQAKSPPGKSKQVEEIKKSVESEGGSKEKAENIAFGKAWNDYKKEKKKKSGITVVGAEIDEHAKTELELYLYNTGELHRQHEAIIENLKRKIRAGKYDDKLAPKLWQYWVDQGARAYTKEFGGTHDRIQDMFPAALRRALAAEIASQEYELIMNGEYGDVGAPKAKPAGVPGTATDPGLGAAPQMVGPKKSYHVYATVNGETADEPIDTFTASSMTEALERIASFGVDGQVLADPTHPSDEALVVIDSDRGDWLHVRAFEAPAVNQQQPDQVSVPEDGAAALQSNGGFKQDRATRKIKKTHSAMSVEDIARTAKSFGLSDAEIEAKLLDGEVVTRNGWNLHINASDEVEFGKEGAAPRVASVLKLDDMIRDFQAAVVMDEPDARVSIAELFQARCASCKSVNEYVMPETASPLTCGKCAHVASADAVAMAFARSAGAKKHNDYLITVEVPGGRDERDFNVNAKRLLSAVRAINASADMETDASIKTAELTVRKVDSASLSRIEKVLSEVFGAMPTVSKTSQYVGKTPSMQATPGLDDPSMQHSMQTMNLQPGAQQKQMQDALKPMQPGKINLGAGAGALAEDDPSVIDREIVQQANKIVAQMMGDEGMGGEMPPAGGMMPPEMPPPGGDPMMGDPAMGGMPGDPAMAGGAPQMPMGDMMDNEGREAAHASILHYRNQGMGVLDALAEFHRQYSDYLESFGEEVSPERHMIEAEVVKIAGEVYSKPALIQRAAHMMEQAMRMYAGVLDLEDSVDDDYVTTNAKLAFEAPHANTQQADWVAKSKLHLEPDSSGKEPGFGPKQKPTPQGGTGHRQPGATPSANPKPAGDLVSQEPHFGDKPFGSDAQAGSQHEQPGESWSDTNLGADSSTGETKSTKKMDSVSKSAPGNVRSK